MTIIKPEDATEGILIDALAPRPLAWILTRSGPNAIPNIAPFSALTLVGNSPPIIFLAILLLPTGLRKATALNIIANKIFSINFPSYAQLPNLMRSADPQISSFERINIAGVELSPGHCIDIEHFIGANYSFECSLIRHEYFDIGKSDMFWCKVHAIHLSSKPHGDQSPSAFTGTLGYNWFVSENGLSFVEQSYIKEP